ncbi:major facilitator superfamily domain-containing protein 1 [Tribolium castaneum]|uniref:Lysosomal dipeptide transporter MFSD1 n=1 Tax=Tribolium castaneum TaxID=7070 RepID=A0A139WH97_TRICA|nr:PREDICTED: major facilitator superfamily domain-containing protein 1 isoform X1 [Tribolium castaneum]KYB27225.1 Major facilitator superfamily domain-containing protein 1-like Protein [Tribolium castaneum]|eukprot:XP_972526.2 PREDICTED: major facilitator superfamily domain-containing protein 1 isoform X1 [Tribolium castaneum]
MEGGPNIQEADDTINSSTAEEGGNSGCYYSCCDPRGRLHRFIALIFMCFLGFGSYFCYDNPAALEGHIEKTLNITTTQYSLLYSMYSWPNVVLCFVGGFLIDRVFGIRLGTNIYSGLTLLGQIIFASGALFDVFWIMIMGRFIFGIGAESLAVAQNNYAVLWFKGKELNMVFGLQLSFARIGSTVNFLVMESIYQWVNKEYKGTELLGIVLFVATSTCLFSMLCALVLGFMDKRAENLLRRHETTNPEVVRFTDVIEFKFTFWLIAVICVSYYVAIFPFIALGEDLFIKKFHMSKQEANTINSLIYLISGVASPLVGLFIDKVGKNILWIVVAISVTIGSHTLWAFTDVNAYVGMVILGLAYACLASSLWPLVSLIIPEYQLGTAYGVCQAIQNLGLAVFTIVAGHIKDTYGYIWLEVFFICTLIVALVFTLVLWLVDMYQRGVLNMTPGNRVAHQERLSSAADAEKQRLLSSEASSSNDNDNLQPSSDFEIRNRYLSRIGAPLPDHYSIQNKGLSYRALR